ncbi:cytochrome P450 [Lentzea sp. NBRC 105346]|uniref:cytochrome P450 n=1 Tax=Lentzea sp. NBRC 105346 TaxID=3032205 RepID=UPI0025561DB5|nr:cytochrome P450 [Lentzea sp. NBRC 105346]GLZ33915.1 cytochrome P450 [Lentzea sp. NBRC 105346]
MTDSVVSPLPIDRTHPLQVPDGTDAIAAEGARKVVFPNGVETWLFTRYADVRMLLSDRRFTAYKNGDAPEMRTEESIIGAEQPGNMIIRDGAEHLRLRRPVSRALVVKRIDRMRPRIQEIVDTHLDAIERAGAPADLVPMLCLPVPSLVIAELLGVPHEHQALFQRTAQAMLGLRSTLAEYEEAAAELGGVLEKVVDRKRAEGVTGDLLGLLVNGDYDFDLEELLFLAIGLLVAGHETTSNFMGLFVLTLFDHPEQLDLLRADLSRVDSVVEELMRHTVSIGGGGLVRRATEDVRVGDVLVRGGEWVAASLYANSDPALCPHADRLDLSRESTPHVAFGFGPHQCVGQNLARAELQIMLRSLFTRFPGLRLAEPLADLPFRTDMLTYGPASVPVVW